MTTDRELLESYARERSESAFAELVARHINVVYAAALRETRGDTGQAEDITQAVFGELARKASRLCRHPALAGWLYTCVRHFAANTRRSEDRRKRREQEAHTMKELLSPDSSDAAWREIQPVLDDAMHELNETDRAAVVLRFFEDRSHKEVGRALGLEESAARMRVERALEKLRTVLGKRGITSTASGLTAALAVGASMSAPTGLAAGVSATALAGASGGGAATTFWNLMSASKIKAAAIGAMAVAGLGTTLVMEYETRANIRSAGATYERQEQQLTALLAENKRLSNSLAATGGSSANSPEELQRLRDTVASLRPETNRLAALRAEDARLQAALRGARQSRSSLLTQTAELRQESMARVSEIRELGTAVLNHVANHPDEVATNLDQMWTSFAANGTRITNLDVNGYELVYAQTWKDSAKFAHPSSILVLRQKKPWRASSGQLAKVYFYLDGGATVLSGPEENFEAWERQHIASPEPPK